MTQDLTRTPLDKMSDSCLRVYITEQIADFPVKLRKKEKDALYTAMWNSVVTMKLKQMSQNERDAYYKMKKREAEIKLEVSNQIKERNNRLKTHHVFV